MLRHSSSPSLRGLAPLFCRWGVAVAGCLLWAVALPLLVQGQRLSLEEDPTVAPLIVRGQGDAVVLTFYSSLTDLSFGSNLIGSNQGILSNRSQPTNGRYILLISPEPQTITIRAAGHQPQTLRLHRYRTQSGKQWAYRVEPTTGPQATGSLTIKTEPQGADLRIAGFPNLPMRTPYELSDYPTGEYAISLNLAGYESVDARVTIEAGDTQNITYVLTQKDAGQTRTASARPQRQPVQQPTNAPASRLAQARIENDALVIGFSRRSGDVSNLKGSFDPDANIIVVELQTTAFTPIEEALTASGLFADVVWHRRAVARSQRRTQQELSTLWLYPRSDLTIVRGKLLELDALYQFTFTLAANYTPTRPVSQNRQEQLTPALRGADVDWQAGRKEAAITKLENLLRNDPRNKAALLRLGDAYFSTNRYSHAATQYATLVDTDQAWTYPEARVKWCSALLEATYTLSSTCAQHLERYLSREPNGRHSDQARHLLSLHRTPTQANLLTTRRDIRTFIQQRLEPHEKSLVYLWEAECTSCISDLQRLYAYAAQNPSIQVAVVSLDRMRDHRDVNDRLTYTFADFRERNLSNVHFFQDADRQLERYLIPSGQRRSVVPRALFMRKDKVNVVWNGLISWDSPRVAAAWQPTTTPGW